MVRHTLEILQPLKVTPPWVLFTFLNCTNGTKSHNVSHMHFDFNDSKVSEY